MCDLYCRLFCKLRKIICVLNGAEAELVLHYDFTEVFGEPNVYDSIGDTDAVLNLGVVRVTDDTDFEGVVGFPGITGVRTNVRAGEWLDAPMEGGDFTVAVLWKRSDPNHLHECIIGWDGLFVGAVYDYVYGAWAAFGTDNNIYYNEVHYPGMWHNNIPG